MGYVIRSAALAIVIMLSSAWAKSGPVVGHPLKVVDTNGQAIGTLLAPNAQFSFALGGTGLQVLRREGTIMLLVFVLPNGSGFNAVQHVPYFETTDCSGQPYLSTGGSTLLRYTGVSPQATLPFTTVDYPGDPIQTKTLRSWRVAAGCETLSPPTIDDVGPLETLDLSGYVPPFKLK